jgi:hypothetical protein
MIYVDDLKSYDPKDSHTRRWGRQWCHMWTDGDVEELHIFAEKLGLKRGYFQNKRTLQHYDIIPTKRKAALKMGAVYMPLKTWLFKIKEDKSCAEH